MNPTVSSTMLAIALAAGLFLSLLACLEIGYRLGRRVVEEQPERSHKGISSIEAAVFALLGLLLAFSFAGAMSRFDTNRQLIVQEANAIGTAYLRLDLLPADRQPEIRRLFRGYVENRLQVYEKLPDVVTVGQELARGAEMQQAIWSRAVAASKGDASQVAALLLLPAINEMIDFTTTRTIALNMHIPKLITFLLIAVILMSGLVAGYAMAKRGRRSWFHTFLYASIVAVTMYAIMDMEYPSAGLIRFDPADKALIDLLKAMG